jgi:hypothetical protein
VKRVLGFNTKFFVSVTVFEPEQARKHSLRRGIKPDSRINKIYYREYAEKTAGSLAPLEALPTEDEVEL